jgi:predicted nucleotidyltransferase
MESMDRVTDSVRATYAALLESSLKRVVTILSNVEGIRRISLVGSFARGRADRFTDLDILVVMETDLSFIDRLRMLYPLLALPVDLDLLCYTPDEFERMQDRPFMKHLRGKEVVLYETHAL